MSNLIGQPQITGAVAMTGHETSLLAFELVLQPSSLSEKLLKPFIENKCLGVRVKEIPQPLLGVLTEFLQELQIDSKIETMGATKDPRRRASLQLMVIISIYRLTNPISNISRYSDNHCFH